MLSYRATCLILEPDTSLLLYFIKAQESKGISKEDILFLCASPRSCSIADSANIEHYHTLYTLRTDGYCMHTHEPITSSDEYKEILRLFFYNPTCQKSGSNLDAYQLAFAATFCFFVLNLIRQSILVGRELSRIISTKERTVFLLDSNSSRRPTLNNGLSRSFALLVYKYFLKSHEINVREYKPDLNVSAGLSSMLVFFQRVCDSTLSFLSICQLCLLGDFVDVAIGSGVRAEVAHNASATIDSDSTCLSSPSRSKYKGNILSLSSCFSRELDSLHCVLSKHLSALYEVIQADALASIYEMPLHRLVGETSIRLFCSLSDFYRRHYLSKFTIYTLLLRLCLKVNRGRVLLSDQLSMATPYILRLLRKHDVLFTVIGHSVARREQKLRSLLAYLPDMRWHDEDDDLRPLPNRTRFTSPYCKDPIFIPEQGFTILWFSYAAYKWHTQKFPPHLVHVLLLSLADCLSDVRIELKILRKSGSESRLNLLDIGIDVTNYPGLCNVLCDQLPLATCTHGAVLAISHFGMAHFQSARQCIPVVYIFPELSSLPNRITYVPVKEFLSAYEVPNYLRHLQRVLSLPGCRRLLDLFVTTSSVVLYYQL